jgi:hypothetical protein
MNKFIYISHINSVDIRQNFAAWLDAKYPQINYETIAVLDLSVAHTSHMTRCPTINCNHRINYERVNCKCCRLEFHYEAWCSICDTWHTRELLHHSLPLNLPRKFFVIGYGYLFPGVKSAIIREPEPTNFIKIPLPSSSRRNVLLGTYVCNYVLIRIIIHSCATLYGILKIFGIPSDIRTLIIKCVMINRNHEDWNKLVELMLIDPTSGYNMCNLDVLDYSKVVSEF